MDQDASVLGVNAPEIWGRLAEYFAGAGSLKERAAMERWIEADPRRAESVARMREVWDAKAGLRRTTVADAAWERFRARPAHPLPRDVRLRRHIMAAVSHRAVSNWVAAAAMILVVAGATYSLTRRTPQVRPVVRKPEAAAREIQTLRGQRATLDLADGTRIELAPESWVRVPRQQD